MTSKRITIVVIVLVVAVFMGWRFVRPMNIFAVTGAFERPMDTSHAPEMFGSLSAKECAACHAEIYDDWSTTIHSQAWTDPYYQVDLEFDGSQQICLNCHIPLDRQQENLVLGFNDAEKWDPILAPNPDFDADLQAEGVTCAACHLKGDKILGVRGGDQTPHAVEKMQSGNEICVRCHVVSNEGWDTFFRFPPCGTVAEIQNPEGGGLQGGYGEMTVDEIEQLNCVGCHMPIVERPVAEGGEVRTTRRHLWRGGHDPAMVKSALDIDLSELPSGASDLRLFRLALSNVGAAHYVPTGTPDRHFTVRLRTLDRDGEVLDEQDHTLKRTIMWRPFIVDLWDTRLAPGEVRNYDIEFPADGKGAPVTLEAVVTYFLVDEKRRKRIGYEDKEATFHEVYRQRVTLSP